MSIVEANSRLEALYERVCPDHASWTVSQLRSLLRESSVILAGAKAVAAMQAAEIDRLKTILHGVRALTWVVGRGHHDWPK